MINMMMRRTATRSFAQRTVKSFKANNWFSIHIVHGNLLLEHSDMAIVPSKLTMEKKAVFPELVDNLVGS